MKGIILAGGSGTRLLPSTKVTNKHLLPVYNKPMIYYPIETMLKAGITDILILPGKDHAGAFAQLLGSGADFNAHFTYRVQESAGGLAYAVGLAETFVGNDSFLVLLGDNIFFDDFSDAVRTFTGGAHVFLKEVPDPNRFGIAALNGSQVTEIIEKPAHPPSPWAVAGAYIYDAHAFEYIRSLKPSGRGELEITDLNNTYIKAGAMQATFLKDAWFDAGTPEALVDAATAIRSRQKPVDAFKAGSAPQVQTLAPQAPQVCVGMVLYESLLYLPEFLDSLAKQDYRSTIVCAVDNNVQIDNEDVQYIRSHYPHITVVRSPQNVGFGSGHNVLIREAAKRNCDFYCALNTDIILETNVISELVNTLLKNPRAGASTGKLKRWHFTEVGQVQRTNFIDSAGLSITPEHRFTNRGEGDIDHGQYDREEEIFGVSGALAMYRVSALQETAFINEKNEKEYFDELMFMYKEDVDLAYRLQWGGYAAFFNPSAVAFHDRSVVTEGASTFAIVKGRQNRSRHEKASSWLNHHIILSKYLNRDYPLNVRAKIAWYEAKSLIYALIFEPYLLGELMHLFTLRKEIGRRRAQIKRSVNYQTVAGRWLAARGDN